MKRSVTEIEMNIFKIPKKETSKGKILSIFDIRKQLEIL